MAGESPEQRTERLRSVVESGYVPAARVAGRPEGWGAGRAAAPGRPSGELQLRLDFDAVAGPAAERSHAADGDRWRRRAGRSSRPRTCRPRSRRRSWTRAGSRSAARTGSTTSRRGSRPSRRSASRCWPTTRGRAAGRRWRSPSPAPDGRVVAADGAEAADALRRLLAADRHAARRARGQVGPRRGASPTTRRRAPLPIAFDTQIAAYILNAALRSQTIADILAENLDQILPPPAELPATARAGLEALSAIAVREPLERRLAEVKLDRLFREVELPLIPVLARMEAVGRRARPRRARRPRPRVRRRDHPARAGDLRRRRPRVQPRQPQAARADPVLRAEPAKGQADEDRLLDRRLRARGAAPGAPDDRQAARVAGLHEAALDLRRGAAHR